MTTLSRRTFLAGSAAGAAAATAVGAAAPVRAATKVPVTRETHRVVVIGSGFGGGVTALRLAEAGVPVVVLERGRRWDAGPDSDTFPRGSSPDKRALWYESNPTLFGQPAVFPNYVGLLETVSGINMTVAVASGVGGGSLAYQGMTLQPSEEVFAQVLPEALNYRRLDAVHYPRVAKMLQIAQAPDELINSKTYLASRLFARNTARAGYTYEKIPMPIDWSFALRELKGEMKPSYTNGDCALGVNNGGKHSVDVTYLAAAEATGLVDVRPQHQVTEIARAKDGRWVTTVKRLDENARTVEVLELTSTALVMGAGSVGTSRLLLRAKAHGSIPDLPDGVGKGWGSNGDRIYVWTDFADDFGAVQGGPVIYGSKEWTGSQPANTVIQAALPPTGLNLRSTMLVGFGVSPARGQFTYDAGLDQAILHWPKDGDAALHKRIRTRVDAIAGKQSMVTDTFATLPSTWHPLGGANMGTVCDLDGRVLGQKGLYVTDGALIPGSTGACNPSMTIAAVAERALDEIVRNDAGKVF